MRQFLFLFYFALAGGGSSYAESQDEALQTLLETYQAEEGNIENLLHLDNAVNAAIIDKALTGLEGITLPAWGDGEIVIYEFSDYQCGYCRHMFPQVDEAVTSGQAQVKIIEFPILSELSHKAARYALAAQQQGKYAEFHKALMQGRQLSERTLADAIADNLDIVQAEEYIHSPEVEEQLQRNYQLATLLKVSGTPAFIINGQVIRGALRGDDWHKLLAKPQ